MGLKELLWEWRQKIPPHNLTEIIDGLIALVENPDITIDELKRVY